MSELTSTEFGTNVQKYPLVTDYNSYFQEFAQEDMRIPTNILKRFYMTVHIPQATYAVGTYTIGILPIKAYLVDVKHVVKTVTAASTIEVEVGSKGDCMTAQSATNTVTTASLNATPTNRLGSAGDIVIVKILTASGDLLHLNLTLAFEPYR